jgi:hypothetical protein
MRYFAYQPKADNNGCKDSRCIIAVEGNVSLIDMTSTFISCFRDPKEVSFKEWSENRRVEGIINVEKVR